MDVIALTFTALIGFVSLLVMIGLLDERIKNSHTGDGLKFCGIVIGICCVIAGWTLLAQAHHDETPIVTYHPIEMLRNIPFYINDRGKAIEITGDGRFADPKTTQYRITVIPGGWKYCMYVTESRKTDMVRIDGKVESGK